MRLAWISTSILVLCSIGCAASGQLRLPTPGNAEPYAHLENPVATGGDHPVVDRVEAVVRAPIRGVRKLLRKEGPAPEQVESDRRESVYLSAAFLQQHDLSDVYIDVRRYEPGEQWQRLVDNDRVSPFWKYSGGTLNWLGYVMLPARAFHQDGYDPFTNTLSLNSADPVEALYEASSAKEYREHRYLGTYAMAQRLPLIPLFHCCQTGRNALDYARERQDSALEAELYPRACAEFGATSLGEAFALTPVASTAPFYVAPLLSIGGSAAGSMTGQAIAKRKGLSAEESP